MRMVDDRRMNVALNEKLFEEIACLKYFSSHITIDGEIHEEVSFGMTEAGKV